MHIRNMMLTRPSRGPIGRSDGTITRLCVCAQYNKSERRTWLTTFLPTALTKLETDWWIELESTYRSRIAQRKELYAKNGKAVLDALPGSELACKELMEMVLQFVCARYPQHFTLVDKHILKNHILGTEQDLRDKHPLEILLENVPEDFALMLRDDKTGFYFLRAAVICSALGWNVASKIGRQLHQIHAPIPDYKEKMQFSMDRYVCFGPSRIRMADKLTHAMR